MAEIKTDELFKVIKGVHSSGYDTYVEENKDSMLSPANDFYSFIRTKLKENSISQKTLFVKADISETYGYKLLSGEKKTRQRDVILRMLIAAKLDFDEVQSALHKYGMEELYPKNKRDALLIMCINEKRDMVSQVNEILKNKGFDELKSTGA